MFQISPAQSSQLAAASHDDYLRRVETRIRQDFTAEFEAVPPEELPDQIRRAFDRFRERGFHRKEHLHRLIVLELLYGPSFENALPSETRSYAFDAYQDAPEAERFWAIYRAADALHRPEEGATDPNDPYADLTFAVDAP